MRNVSVIKGLLISISIITLAACSSDNSAPPSPKTAAPMPPITEMDMAMEKPAPKPLPLAQSDTVTPIEKAAAAPANPLAPSSSLEERMARLEQNVGALQSDYNRIMPAFATLNTTNERIQTLLDEIEKETGKRPVIVEASDAEVAPAEAPKPAVAAERPSLSMPPMAGLKAEPEPPKPASAAPVAAAKPAEAQTAAAVKPAAAPTTTAVTASSTVTGVRIGEHGDKTRIVFDLTAKAKPDFNYDLDNAEKLLLINLPASAWAGAESGKASAAAPLIQGWTVQKEAAGSTLAIQLKKGARVLSTEYLKAEGKDGPRLVVDIASN